MNTLRSIVIQIAFIAAAVLAVALLMAAVAGVALFRAILAMAAAVKAAAWKAMAWKSMLPAVLCGVLLSPFGAQASPFTFTLGLQPPGGVVSGMPGQLTGWGYILTNTDGANWFVPTQLSASSFSLGTPDASYFDFPILGPGLGAAMAFDPVAGTGLFGLQFNPAALPGQSESGQFTLAGEWWSGDPLAGGAFLQASDHVLAPFTVQVAGGAVPEPATLPLLMAAGLPWLVLRRRRHCR